MTNAQALARVNARPVNNTRPGAYQLVSERLPLAIKAAKEPTKRYDDYGRRA